MLHETWLIEPHQRVELRFRLERAVEALHGVVDVAIGRNKSSCRASPLGTRQSMSVAAIFGVMPTLVFVDLPNILVELPIDNIFVSINRCVDR